MSDDEQTKDCPRCRGRGKHPDPARGPLVAVRCERCEGSGEVPADSPDEPPREPKHIPFGARRD